MLGEHTPPFACQTAKQHSHIQEINNNSFIHTFITCASMCLVGAFMGLSVLEPSAYWYRKNHELYIEFGIIKRIKIQPIRRLGMPCEWHRHFLLKRHLKRIIAESINRDGRSVS